MADSNKLSTAIQENVLVLLVFSTDYFRWARHAIDPDLFDYSVYRTIAEKAIAFIDAYDAAPQDHIFDELDAQVKDPKRGKLFTDALQAMWQLHKDRRINATYVQQTLHNFRQRQQIVNSIIEAGNNVKQGHLDKAKEVILNGFRDVDSTLFDPGLQLSDIDKAFSRQQERTEFSFGIPAFDQVGVVPHRGELLVVQGQLKFGKSMSGVHLGCLALRRQKRIAHITLELSKELTYQRYIQNLFSIPERDANSILKNTILKSDEYGIATGIDFQTVDLSKRPSINSDKIKSYLVSKLKKMKGIPANLYIKQYPTRGCSMMDIRAYLDGLEQVQRFIPDMLIVDYADLMKVDISNYRLEIGAVYQELRGLAIERNISVITFSQSNRAAESAKTVSTQHAAEDYSKPQVADLWLIGQRTEAERRLNLARIFVAASRVTEDKFWSLISQQYSLAKFVVSSSRLPNHYDPAVSWT